MAERLNDFNTITNQLESTVLDFGDEVRALVLILSFTLCQIGRHCEQFLQVCGDELEEVIRLVFREEARKRALGEGFGSIEV